MRPPRPRQLPIASVWRSRPSSKTLNSSHHGFLAARFTVTMRRVRLAGQLSIFPSAASASDFWVVTAANTIREPGMPRSRPGTASNPIDTVEHSPRGPPARSRNCRRRWRKGRQGAAQPAFSVRHPSVPLGVDSVGILPARLESSEVHNLPAASIGAIHEDCGRPCRTSTFFAGPHSLECVVVGNEQVVSSLDVLEAAGLIHEQCELTGRQFHRSRGRGHAGLSLTGGPGGELIALVQGIGRAEDFSATPLLSCAPEAPKSKGEASMTLPLRRS